MKNKFPKLEKALSRLDGKLKKIERAPVSQIDRRSNLLKDLETKGREVDLLQEVTFRDDGLLELDGQQIVIYIKDNTNIGWGSWRSYYGDEKALDPVTLKKVHLRHCSTISMMIADGRKDRYIASQNKTGWFLIDIPDKEIETRLNICKNCLSELNYNNYKNSNDSMRQKILKSFNITEFFENYESKFNFNPKYTEHTAPSNTYTLDWHYKSFNCRNGSDWICKKCGVNLSNHTYLLDAHHRSGIKSDNRPSNLEALCKACHRKEPHHSHMSPKNDSIIRRLRREQGIPNPD